GPHHVAVERRDRECGDVGKDFGAGLVEIDRTAGRAFGTLVVARQIRTDRLPRLSVIVAHLHVLRRDEQLFGIGGGEQNRMRPTPAITHLFRRAALFVVRIRRDAAVLSGAIVVAQEDREVAAAVGYVRIVGLRGDERALAVGRRFPIFGADRAAERRARAGDRAVVLLRAVDAEREL